MNWLDQQKSATLKKFMFQILETGFPVYDDLLSRIAFSLITDNDLSSFSKMIGEIYEKGYMKAVADYQEQLAKLNIKVNISQKEL